MDLPENIRIDELPLIDAATSDHLLPAILASETGGLSVGKVLALLIDDAPAPLATLKKLAAAIGDDPNFAGTIGAALAAIGDDLDTKADADAVTSALALKVNASAIGVAGGVQAWSQKLVNLAALAGGADRLPFFTGANSLDQAIITAFARSLLGAVDAAAFWTALNGGNSGNLATNGWARLPVGLIIQWGLVTPGTGVSDFTLSYPVSFPNACRALVPIPVFNNAGSNEFAAANVSSLGQSSCTCRTRYIAGTGPVVPASALPIGFIALGY